jgi:hypothetical protein
MCEVGSAWLAMSHYRGFDMGDRLHWCSCRHRILGARGPWHNRDACGPKRLSRDREQAPSEFYAHHHLRFERDAVMSEDKLRELVGAHGFTIANLSQQLVGEGRIFEYRMVNRSRNRGNAQTLSQHLLSLPEVIEFRISPTGD